jgi:transposase-like protein
MESRKRYSQEFKREAVAQCEAPGVTMQQVARELGVNPRLLSRWRSDLRVSGEKAFPGQGNPRDEEMTALKRELARVTKERDFLREAAAFFAKTSK